MSHDLVIDVKHLTKRFGERLAVDQFAIQVNRGEVFAFLGPNGSGKTTTIRMLCGLLTPDEAEGSCLGFDVLKESAKIKRHVGYMTQRFSFYEDLSVEENLNFIAKVYQIENPKRRVETLLSEMGLTARRHQLTGELSGGWKQRVALTACLLHDPDLLLLDEPTSGVDPLARRLFWDTIHRLSEQGITTFVSTHYMEEALYCTRLAYLANAKLVVSGTVQDVIDASAVHAWEITGEVSMELLQQLKTFPQIEQATLLEQHIRVCGLMDKAIEDALGALRTAHFSLSWRKVNPTLEDAFIALVKQAGGGLS